jgi:hypothetical protein
VCGQCVTELKNDISAFEKSSVRKNMTPETFQTTKIFNHFFYWGMLTVSGDCRQVHPESIGLEDEKDKQEQEEAERRNKSRGGGISGRNGGVGQPALAHSILRDLRDTGAGAGAVEEAEAGAGVAGVEEGDREGEEEEGDDEMALLLKEMEWLRLEGNRKAADLIEKKINKIRLEKLKKIRAQ